MKEKLQHFLLKNYNIPKAALIESTVSKFSLTEKLIFYSLAIILCLSSGVLLWQVNRSFMVEIPGYGGNLTEGVVGLPRFINPVIAVSDADRDLTALIYSGLLKVTADGSLVPDLAESYSISSDGLTYAFTLKPEIKFHDKTPLTADDVVFTIQKTQDPSLKSPKRPNWEGIVAEKVNDREVKLTLKQAYSPFLENATLGILPKRLWNTTGTEEFQFSKFNTEPIGSGPYKVKTVERNSSGIPLYYRLEAFDKYIFGKPFIKNVVIRFYQNNNDLLSAYNKGAVQSMAGISPQQASEIKEQGGRVERIPLQRIFAAFFNQNHAPLLANKEVRQALNIAVDKEVVVKKVLNGEGVAINGPIPPGLLQKNTTAFEKKPFMTELDRVAAAKKILENANWKFNEEKKVYEKKVKKDTVSFVFSISTSNAPELKATAQILKEMWEKIGASVEIKIFDIGELNQNVIRTRKYDILLFGEIIGRDLDLYAFWHSSQRNDPGLNIALYANAKADKLLDDARTITNRDARLEKYRALEQEIQNDIPAIFIYSPDFLYVAPKRLKGFSLGHITVPSERFLDIERWYVETEHIWKIFAEK
ncbi:MAG: Extracellular solute-binding protein family 5 [candidate division CPR1 bacterium GW2011_GWA2_42_17]|uniref:Extracellular solute-binding protein family 5 n=1 Tax=candidate division CPR1 bacterium GW2011_GWA2_42_17 TaxID=1618341 RepID=A0A0G1C3Q4_9BACT|nr:MAG: Extracellular solute-binding protein family 5 [candidate division CPR1 bacterium GW2011_GWA2_42_17]